MTRPARQGEGALSDAIREALALERDLVLLRNSADLVGLLQVSVSSLGFRPRVRDVTEEPAAYVVGRFVALEIKVPGKVAEPHQEAWLASVRARGGFAAVVDSVESARAAIGRARVGASQ